MLVLVGCLQNLEEIRGDIFMKNSEHAARSTRFSILADITPALLSCEHCENRWELTTSTQTGIT